MTLQQSSGIYLYRAYIRVENRTLCDVTKIGCGQFGPREWYAKDFAKRHFSARDNCLFATAVCPDPLPLEVEMHRLVGNKPLEGTKEWFTLTNPIILLLLQYLVKCRGLLVSLHDTNIEVLDSGTSTLWSYDADN